MLEHRFEQKGRQIGHDIGRTLDAALGKRNPEEVDPNDRTYATILGLKEKDISRFDTVMAAQGDGETEFPVRIFNGFFRLGWLEGHAREFPVSEILRLTPNQLLKHMGPYAKERARQGFGKQSLKIIEERLTNIIYPLHKE